MLYFNKLRKSKIGFTLIELIVVIAILAVLAAILVPVMIVYLNNARAQQEESNARAAYSSACSAYTICSSKGEVFDEAIYNLDTDSIVIETKRLLGDTAVTDLNILMRDGAVVGIQINEDGCVVEYNIDKKGTSGYSAEGFKHTTNSHND